MGVSPNARCGSFSKWVAFSRIRKDARLHPCYRVGVCLAFGYCILYEEHNLSGLNDESAVLKSSLHMPEEASL